jgi:hypothetical protein
MTQTVGKASLELMQQIHEQYSPIEYEREMHKEYEKNILECIDTHKKLFASDFYVVVLRKRERLMENVYRTYFLGRLSCPTPTYDQTVYKYHYKEEALEFIWTIPDLETCTIMKRDALLVPDMEKELLQFVLDFQDGVLDIKTKILNNEITLIEG